MMDRENALTEIQRLRNRHVAKILSFLGDPPPYIENAVKRSFTMFADDVTANIINSENREQSDAAPGQGME
jgi:hypothetical protein